MYGHACLGHRLENHIRDLGHSFESFLEMKAM